MPIHPLKPLPTTWDSLLRKHAGNLPVPFLRALIQRESSMNPKDTHGPAWGLMQITEVVRRGQTPSRYDLLDPDINVRIGTGLLKRIVNAYNKHPDANMKEDWGNPEYVNLVLAGWNSGYSEGGGVGRVARYLEDRRIPVTHDNVFKFAAAAGATSQLQKPAKQAWQKSVTDLYFRQPDALSPGEKPVGFLMKAGVAVLVGLVVAKYVFK